MSLTEFLLKNFIMIPCLSFFVKSPLLLVFLILAYIVVLSMIMSFFAPIWVSYILILLMAGGMMVIFSYLGSLVGSEKLILSKSSGKVFIFISISIWMITSQSTMSFSKLYSSSNLFQMFYQEWSFAMWFIIIFILLTMVTCVKLVKLNRGALKLTI